MPLTSGLAGHCARYGVPVVVADAYADSRFDRSVDASVGAAVGFKTQSVVCVPIRDPDGDVVGVLQAINRMASGSSPFDTDGDFAPPVAAGADLFSAAATAAAAASSGRGLDAASGSDGSTSGSLRGRTSTGAAGRSHNKLLALIDDAEPNHHHDASSASSATASPRVPATPLPVPGSAGSGTFGFGAAGAGGSSSARSSGVFFGTYNKPPLPATSTSSAAAAASSSSAAGAGARPAGDSAADEDAEPLPIWPFTPSDVQLLEGMAAHTAVALRTAQLLEGLARGQKMTAALLDIVQSSASSKPMAALVEQIVGAAYTLLDCERVSLYLVDSVKQELWMAVAKDSDAVGTRIPIGHGLAGYVAATGQPLNIPDAYSDSRFDPTLDQSSGFTTKSVLVWPIAIADLMPGASSGSSASASGGAGAGNSALQRTASRRRGGAGGGAAGSAVPSSSVIAVLQAINKRASSLTRVATAASLLRAQAGLPSAAAAAAADAAAAAAAHLRLSTAARELRAIIPSAVGTSDRFAKPPTPAAASLPHATSSAVAVVAAGSYGDPATAAVVNTGITRFDANDEKMMGAFCAEVSVALKRRSVEAAFMKVLSDSASAGGSVVTGVPEEFNVSLLALYTDAGTSARLHTSVQVRRLSVERSIAPLAVPLTLPSGSGSGSSGGSGGSGAAAGAASLADAMTSPAAPHADGSAAAADPAAAAAATLARKPAVRASFTARAALLAADADGVGVSAKSGAAVTAGDVASGDAESPAVPGPLVVAGDLDSSDPLLTWDWNVFALPLTGMPSLLLDPVMHASELTTLARGAPLADGGLGADGAPMQLTHGCLTNHLQPSTVAAGEQRLAAAVPAMFRQFALLRRFGIEEAKFAAFTRAVRRK